MNQILASINRRLSVLADKELTDEERKLVIQNKIHTLRLEKPEGYTAEIEKLSQQITELTQPEKQTSDFIRYARHPRFWEKGLQNLEKRGLTKNEAAAVLSWVHDGVFRASPAQYKLCKAAFLSMAQVTPARLRQLPPNNLMYRGVNIMAAALRQVESGVKIPLPPRVLSSWSLLASRVRSYGIPYVRTHSRVCLVAPMNHVLIHLSNDVLKYFGIYQYKINTDELVVLGNGIPHLATEFIVPKKPIL